MPYDNPNRFAAGGDPNYVPLPGYEDDNPGCIARVVGLILMAFFLVVVLLVGLLLLVNNTDFLDQFVEIR